MKFRKLKLNFRGFFSLKNKVMILFLVTGVVPLFLYVLFLNDSNESTNGNRLIDGDSNIAIDGRSFVKQKAQHLSHWINSKKHSISAFSSAKSVVEVAKAFKVTFERLPNEVNSTYSYKKIDRQVKDVYSSYSFPFKYDDLVNSWGDSGLFLQFLYLSRNPYSAETENFNDSQDPSGWTRVHKEHHGYLTEFSHSMGFANVLIIDNSTDRVVYSSKKGPYLGVKITDSLFKEHAIFNAYSKSRMNAKSSVIMSDLRTSYSSKSGKGYAFATPIHNDEVNGATLVFEASKTLFNDGFLNFELSEWGLPKSIDLYLIDKKGRMLSNSRKVIDEDENYFESEMFKVLASKKLGVIKKEKSEIGEAGVLPGLIDVLNNGGNSYLGPTRFKWVSSAFIAPAKLSAEGDFFLVFEDSSGFIGNSSSVTKSDVDNLGWDTGNKWVDKLLNGLDNRSALIILVSLFLMAYALSRVLIFTVKKLIHELKEIVVASNETSLLVKEASQTTSSATTQQASAIQETVATLNQINAMVSRSVDNAEKSAELSMYSSKMAKEGHIAVGEMAKAINLINDSNKQIMDEINESNNQLSEIVGVITEISEKTKVINDIVFQTKLLSFNASVEAARAGEHGKGFAVVAEEVGSLAQMSGNAANEIKQMLAESIDKVEGIVVGTREKVERMVDSGRSEVEAGMIIAERCSDVLDEVVKNVNNVNHMIGEITEAARQQADGVSNISVAMNQLDDSTHSNASTAYRSLEYSETLLSYSESIDRCIRDMEVEIYGTTDIVKSLEADRARKERIKLRRIKNNTKEFVRAIHNAENSLTDYEKSANADKEQAEMARAVRQDKESNTIVDQDEINKAIEAKGMLLQFDNLRRDGYARKPRKNRGKKGRKTKLEGVPDKEQIEELKRAAGADVVDGTKSPGDEDGKLKVGNEEIPSENDPRFEDV